MEEITTTVESEEDGTPELKLESLPSLEELKAKTLEDLSKAIVHRYEQVRISARKMAWECVQIGALLKVSKEKCKKVGQTWCDRKGEGWLKDKCAISKWTANRYTNLYEKVVGGAKMHHEDKGIERRVKHLSITEAYAVYGIVEKHEPKPDRKVQAALTEVYSWLTDEQQTQLDNVAKEQGRTPKDIVRDAIIMYLQSRSSTEQEPEDTSVEEVGLQGEERDK